MRILDIYIIRKFISTLVFSLVALCLIFLVVDLLENLDEFIDQNATFELIVDYYLSYFPEILKILTPVATLLSTLFSIGGLSNQNEITAMKSGSLSLYRLMLPLVILSLLLSFGQLYFNGWIVPGANEKKIDIEREYLKKRGSSRSIHNLYFRDSPQRNVSMQYYDSKRKTGNRVFIEDFDSDIKPRLLQRMEAKKMIWDTVDNQWLLVDGVKRVFFDKKVNFSKFDTLAIELRITHGEIIQLKRSPSEMNFDELKRYIDMMESGGKEVGRKRIEYYGNYAFPFANFIVILFGVPFASVKKKGGIAIQIGAAMIISFTYLVFSKISQSIGYSASLDPILSGWMANILFAILGLVVLFKTKT